MKYFVIATIFLFFLNSCYSKTINNSQYYVTELNTSSFVLSKDDSLQVKKLEIENKKFSDSCKKYKMDCLLDGGYQYTEFKGGINNFRRIIYENFKLPANAKPSKNKIRIVIGKNDKIKSYDIENTNDFRIKNEINRILNLDEINTWKSGNFSKYKLEYLIELELIIK